MKPDGRKAKQRCDKITELNHSFTPPELALLNEQILAVLADDPIDAEQLLVLVNKRDKLVVSHLDSLHDKQLTGFAEAEYLVNQSLLKIAETHTKESLNAITGLIRSRRSAEKYG